MGRGVGGWRMGRGIVARAGERSSQGQVRPTGQGEAETKQVEEEGPACCRDITVGLSRTDEPKMHCFLGYRCWVTHTLDVDNSKDQSNSGLLIPPNSPLDHCQLLLRTSRTHLRLSYLTLNKPYQPRKICVRDER
jgi:hypothetical protein